MKFYLSLSFLLCLLAFKAIGQETVLVSIHSTLSLDISYQKTTSLIFPASIKSVDRGSRDILVLKAKGADNVLLIKANRDHFPETNLTVITGDGTLHSFTVNYSSSPTFVTFQISKGSAVLLTDDQHNEAEVATTAIKVMKKPKNIKKLKEKKHQVSLSVEGIYATEDVLFYKVRVKNASNIGYGINFLQFTIKDRKHFKRTASQEIGLKPLFVLGDIHNAIDNQEDLELVFAFQKFTISDNKLVEINLQEQNGGRHLNLILKNRHILKAQRI